ESARGHEALMRLSDDTVIQPRLFGDTLRFKLANLVRVTQRQADIIETVQQAVFAETRDLKRVFDAAVRGAHDLRFQVDGQLEAAECIRFVEQVIEDRK